MFKILCLTTGSEIHWPKQYWGTTDKIVPREVQDDIVHSGDTQRLGGIIYFNTREHADWFVRRRLSYNPRRTDRGKLDFMNAVFRASDMDDCYLTRKHMFDIVEC